MRDRRLIYVAASAGTLPCPTFLLILHPLCVSLLFAFDESTVTFKYKIQFQDIQKRRCESDGYGQYPLCVSTQTDTDNRKGDRMGNEDVEQHL